MMPGLSARKLSSPAEKRFRFVRISAIPEAVDALLIDVAKELGTVDILVLNASVQKELDWDACSPEVWTEHLQVNAGVSLRLIQGVLPAMRARGWGRILTMGSAQERRPHPRMAAYAASKCAQSSLVRTLAPVFAPFGVLINNLAPGVIDTDRNSAALSDPVYSTQLLSAIPAARFGKPADLSGAALLLCSDAGSYITGQSLYIDGGLTR
jgi:glucose 1-dehydrogenase